LFSFHQIGGREVSRAEVKRREAVWDLFQSELVFLIDHLMVLKNVSRNYWTIVGGICEEEMFLQLWGLSRATKR
jgi:hypothetical protein